MDETGHARVLVGGLFVVAVVVMVIGSGPALGAQRASQADDAGERGPDDANASAPATDPQARAPVSGVHEVRIDTAARAILDGDTQAAATDAAGLLTRWGEGDPSGTLRLEAEQVTLRTEVATGQRVRLVTGDQVWHQGSHETSKDTFESVTITFEAWALPGVVLAEPSDRSRVEVQARGPVEGSSIANETIAWLGLVNGDAQGPGRLPSYEYRVDEPTARVAQADRGSVRGDFTLFANRARLTVHQDGSEVWRNWTGLRWTQTAPSTEEYELRITEIEVHRGHLSASARDAVRLLGTNVSLDTDGTVTVDRAHGVVRGDEQAYLLDRGDLELTGQARGFLEPVGGHQDPAQSGTASDQGSARSALNLEGDLRVRSAEGLTQVPTSASQPRPDVPLAGLATALGVVGASAFLGVRQPVLLRPLPQRLKRTLYDRWETVGLDRQAEGDLDASRGFYRRLVRLEPGRPMGWFLLARTQLDAGAPDRALETLERGTQQAEVVPLDLLELAAESHAARGEPEAALSTLEKIHEEDEGFAEAIAARLEREDRIPADALGGWRRLRGEGTSLDGYA